MNCSHLVTLLLSTLLAQDPPALPPAASQNPSTPANPSTPGAPGESAPAPTDATLSKDATVDQTLEALHRRGVNLKDFTADVTMKTSNLSLGDSSSQSGTAVYQKKGDGDARMRVTFDKKTEGKKIFDEKNEYLLEGGWLTDRDYARKTEIRRQVLRPGEKLDLLKLGEGPFPLPVGQTPEAVQKQFEVTKVTPLGPTPPAATKDTPRTLPDAIHLKLKPRPDTQFAKKFDSIEVYVDPKTEMPERIVTVNPDQSEKRTTDLTIRSINSSPPESAFTLDPLPPEGWNRHQEKYQD